MWVHLPSGPLQGAEVDGYGCGATLWVTWKGCYDAVNRIQRDWNRHDERETLQRRLEFLATRALEASNNAPPPRWPFSQLVLSHLRHTSPRAFAESVRAMIEALVTACQEEPAGGGSAAPGGGTEAPKSTFTPEAPFNMGLPFLNLRSALATDPVIALEPTNFALPAVTAEEPWPPADGSLVHPVYIHATKQLRTMEHAVQQSRSRSRAVRPDLPELPIPLNASPCVSMILHPGRLVTSSAEPAVRIAIVSMLVRDALPVEIPVTVRAHPWDQSPSSADLPSGNAHGSGSSGGPASASDVPLLTFSIYRDEFTQEGPSGPIEAKRILLLRALPMQRTRVTFEMEPHLMEALGFCTTPPLLLDHRPSAEEGRTSAPPVAIA